MKKKIIALTLCIAMFAVGAIGSTLAYFTDTAQERNTFTVGGVEIELIEEQRNAEGTELEEFEDNKVLMPIVGSAQGEKDEFGQPVAKNYVDKIISVKNTGKSAAYIRVYFAIPSALDDGYETFNAGMNTLHFNFGNYQDENGGWHTTYQNQWDWFTANNKWNYFETVIDNVQYNVYFADYYKAVDADETTVYYLSGVYLDANVDMREGKYIDPRHPDADLSILDGNVTCPVYAVAVQADGFDSIEKAMDGAFGEKYNPWGGEVSNWQD